MKGIDVSEWNGVIDWPKVKPQVGFVYIKSSTGVGADDKRLKQNAEGAKAAGVKYGLYHFATINNINNPVADAKSEAAWFLANVKKYGGEMPPALDIEDSRAHDKEVAAIKEVTTDNADVKRLTAMVTERYRKAIEIFVAEFKKAFDAAGVELIIYSYAPYLNTFLPKGAPMKLWLAGYTKTPILPKAWSTLYMWQYRSDGRIDGITGNVDMNYLKDVA